MDNAKKIIESKTYNHTKNSNIEYYYYSIIRYKSHETTTIEKEYPLGYTLFKIMETLDIMGDYKRNLKKNSVEEIGNKYYEDAEFYKSFLYNEYSTALITDLNYNSLWSIKYFLDLCSKNSKYCSIEYLIVLSSYELIEVKPLAQSIGFNAQKGNSFKTKSEDNIKDLFNTYEKNRENSAFFYSSDYSNLLELCMASLQCIFNEGYIIKKCDNCGNYFIPFNRVDAIYCDRTSPQDTSKTCKEAGALYAYRKKLKNDEASGLYRAIYMQKQMLLRRNPDIIQYKNDFESFKTHSKQWKSDIKNGVKSEEEYINWLESIKRNK